MDLGISGRRAAVAASSGGLGLATAQALAADGVRVAICGRDQARLDAARRTAAAYDWQAVAHRYFATLDLAHRRRLRPLDLPAWPAGAAAG